MISPSFLFQDAECVDKKAKKYCKRQKNREKCAKENVYKNCPLTCDKCGTIVPQCKDKKRKKYCKRQFKNCKNNNTVKKNCQRTCGECGKAFEIFIKKY